jgi:hypothetical protein
LCNWYEINQAPAGKSTQYDSTVEDKKSLLLELQRERVVTRDWGKRMEQDSLRVVMGAPT